MLLRSSVKLCMVRLSCSFAILFVLTPKDLKLISLPIAARVVTDRVSGFSKGFGFVRYATTEEAAKGLKGMDGTVWFSYICFFLS